MAVYPGYPDNRILVGGVDLTERYHLILADGWSISTPETKTYTVDIPGGDGVIDLTDALSGDASYENREATFVLYDIYPDEPWEKIKTEVSNFLHGRAFDFQITMDPGYTYHGRFSVKEYSYAMYPLGVLGAVQLEVDCDPYKWKDAQTYSLNPVGGKEYQFMSGRKAVHPIIECEGNIFVNDGNGEFQVPAGTHSLADVVFRMGSNSLYICSYRFKRVTWSEIGEDGRFEMTWEQAKAMRYDEVNQLGLEEGVAPRSWSDMETNRWEDYSDRRWVDLNLKLTTDPSLAPVVYLTYDWKDL